MPTKKGFTIVELAVVLVVIGIILAMVVKSRQLIESARNRAELAKLMKLEAAAATYFTYVNGSILDMTVYPPGLSHGLTHLNIEHMESLGIVTLGELVSRYKIPGRNGPAYWMGFLCKREVVNNKNYWAIVGPAASDPSVCAMLVVEENVVVRFGVGYSNKRIICLTETFLDDEDLHNGSAMSVRGGPADLIITQEEYKDCMNLSDNSVMFLYHGYKVL